MMDTFRIYNAIIFLLLTIFVHKCFTDEKPVHYESSDNACNRCSCQATKDVNNTKHYFLDCSVRDMKHILAGWPAEFGDNHTGSEIMVSFSGNQIHELNQLPETDAIVSFSCRHCNITEIGPAVFIDVLYIQRVDLSWNAITGDVLRVDIFRGRFNNREYDPISLEELDLSHNSIHTLERKLFKHTPHLKVLNIAYNQFDLIDATTMDSLTNVPELTHLDLSYNHLTTLPDTLFHPLVNIQRLRIEGNQLKTIPGCLSQMGGSLTSLYIGGNPIETITEDSFRGFKKLTNLNISAMPELNAVNSGTFAKLKALQVVSCMNNPKLQTFDIESLKEATDLRQLDISNCSLSKLNADYEFEMPIENRTKYWQNLHKVRLSGNPWNCDCYMAHTLAGIIQYNNATKYSNFKARCSTPYDLAGTLLEDLTVELGCEDSSLKLEVVANPSLDRHPFLRPRAIVYTVVASVVIVGIALIVGFGIVMARRKLSQQNSFFNTPIRYTTVRNSTISTMSSVTVP